MALANATATAIANATTTTTTAAVTALTNATTAITTTTTTAGTALTNATTAIATTVAGTALTNATTAIATTVAGTALTNATTTAITTTTTVASTALDFLAPYGISATDTPADTVVIIVYAIAVALTLINIGAVLATRHYILVQLVRPWWLVAIALSGVAWMTFTFVANGHVRVALASCTTVGVWGQYVGGETLFALCVTSRLAEFWVHFTRAPAGGGRQRARSAPTVMLAVAHLVPMLVIATLAELMHGVVHVGTHECLMTPAFKGALTVLVASHIAMMAWMAWRTRAIRSELAQFACLRTGVVACAGVLLLDACVLLSTRYAQSDTARAILTLSVVFIVLLFQYVTIARSLTAYLVNDTAAVDRFVAAATRVVSADQSDPMDPSDQTDPTAEIRAHLDSVYLRPLLLSHLRRCDADVHALYLAIGERAAVHDARRRAALAERIIDAYTRVTIARRDRVARPGVRVWPHVEARLYACWWRATCRGGGGQRRTPTARRTYTLGRLAATLHAHAEATCARRPHDADARLWLAAAASARGASDGGGGGDSTPVAVVHRWLAAVGADGDAKAPADGLALIEHAIVLHWLRADFDAYNARVRQSTYALVQYRDGGSSSRRGDRRQQLPRYVHLREEEGDAAEKGEDTRD